MESICGTNCSECKLFNNKCKGCLNTNGCPFGKECFISKYIKIGGKDNYELLKKQLIDEFNSLNIEGMNKIDNLYPLNGEFINLEYLLPNGNKIKFLNDDEIYLGNQVESVFNDGDLKKFFGLVCNMSFILVCEYDENCINPELLIYKRR